MNKPTSDNLLVGQQGATVSNIAHERDYYKERYHAACNQRDQALLQCGHNIAMIDKLRIQRDTAVAALRVAETALRYAVSKHDPAAAYSEAETIRLAVADFSDGKTCAEIVGRQAEQQRDAAVAALRAVAWKIDAYQSHWSATSAEREAIYAAIAAAEGSKDQ